MLLLEFHHGIDHNAVVMMCREQQKAAEAEMIMKVINLK